MIARKAKSHVLDNDTLIEKVVVIFFVGEPERVGGVLVWRVRPGVDPVTPGG